jgi:DNA-binding transcriptional LysR family regulator
MQLRKLERHIGVRLLFRDGRRMRPTEAGLAIYHHAKEAIKAESEVLAIVRELNEGVSGKVVIGTTNMIGSYYLPPLLSEFIQDRPDADLSVLIVPKERISAGVVAGDLDFAIMTREGVPPGLSCVEFHRERLVAVTSPTHPLAELAAPTRADLRNHQLVALSRGTGLDAIIALRLVDGDADPEAVRVALHLGHAEAIKRVVRTGLGYAVLFECAVAQELEEGTLADVTPRDMDVSYPPFSMIYRAKKQFSALQSQLLDFLVSADERAGRVA